MSRHRSQTSRSALRRIALTLSLAVALVASVTSLAFGYWGSTGSGTGTATTGTLNPPTGVGAQSTAGTGTATVSWAASLEAANAPAPDGYYVVRYDSSNNSSAACDSSAAQLITAASCSDTSVPVGTYTYVVIAVMKSWTAMSVASAPVDVSKAGQAITFTSTAPDDASYHGQTYTVTATGGASGQPVTFSIDPTASAVCSISGAVVSFIGVGTCIINANQEGSTYYDAAPQLQQSFAVGKASQVITYTSTAPTNAVVDGAGYTPAATGGASTNPVVFTIDESTVGTCSISGGVVTYQHVGTCIVDANQAGTASYAAANQVQQSIAVGQGSQAVNFTSTAPTAAIVNGPTYTVTATGGASGQPVIFTIDPTASSVCSISGTSVSFLQGGTCTINANQAGNADYLPAAQVQQSFTVAKASQTISFTSAAPTSATVGGSYTAVATSTSGLTVTFSSGSQSVCTSSGTNGATFTFVAAGTCIVNADQAGNASYKAASTVQQSFTVPAAAAPTITSVSPSSLKKGTTTTVTVNGTNFQAGATITVSDAYYQVLSVSFVSQTKLTVQIKDTYANSGTNAANLTVTNPDGGSATLTNAIDNKG